jgi:uncharacterized protein (DUF1800 family)
MQQPDRTLQFCTTINVSIKTIKAGDMIKEKPLGIVYPDRRCRGSALVEAEPNSITIAMYRRIPLHTLRACLGYILIFGVIGCAASPADHTPEASDAAIIHLLNRTGFGPTPDSIAEVKNLGIDAYIERQLQPDNLQETPQLQQRLAQLPTLNEALPQLSQRVAEVGKKQAEQTPEQQKQDNERKNLIVKELAQAKILRAIASRAQLQEVMTDFWFNHFNVFAGKGADRAWVGAYERDAIRPFALGKFRDLLRATARHPAMLFYLDNWQNTAPDSPGGQRRKLGINENYARELLELHTLGVDGGYSQKDVTALAYILTGWGLSHGDDWVERSAFSFNPRRHDFSNQVLLGQTVPGGGEQEIEAVLDRLAAHPATAQHIAYQLAQALVDDNPPPSLVTQLARTFSRSDGNIAEVLRELLHSQAFWDSRYRQTKFKPPLRYAVSALRAAQVLPPGDTHAIQHALNTMGQPLYRCVTPNGYANTKQQWLNPDALLKRVDFAKGLKRFDVAGEHEQAIFDSFSALLSAESLKVLEQTPPNQKTVLLLNSPEFLYY